MVTITRKIQLYFNTDEKAEINQFFSQIYQWRRICHKAANWVVTHLYLQENLKELLYITDDIKVRLADIKKDQNGILTTSRDNATYQLLSKKFKGECPMTILGALNLMVTKSYKQDLKDIRDGKRPIRVYSENIPMPIPKTDIRKINEVDDGNYTFTIHNVPFRTNFGRDLSGNKQIFELSLIGAYKLCESKLILDNNKIFLLAVFQFEEQTIALDNKKVCKASLDFNTAIRVQIGRREFCIGTKEEFLYRRLAIQGAQRRVQAAAAFNNGGKGRAKKLQALERFKGKEKDYINSRLHLYSSKLIDLAIKNNCGVILLKVNKESAKSESNNSIEINRFVLRNWSYFGLEEKIKYKCEKYGVELKVGEE